MAEQNFIASIITFNPDIDIFARCLNSVADQVHTIIVWDNNSNNVNEIDDVIKNRANNQIYLWVHDENYGIAKPLNEIVKYAKACGYKWVLTMDQDSVIPGNMIASYEKYSNYPNIGLIGCRTPDRNVGSEEFSGPELDIPKELITSGSFTNVDAWNKVGGFDEKLFIDSVDKDYCINLINNGYTILRVNSVAMSHTIGNIKVVRFFGRKVLIYNHSPFRKYYQIRNMFYLDRKYKKRYTLFAARHFLIGLVKIVFFEEEKINKIKAWLSGSIEGIKLELE